MTTSSIVKSYVVVALVCGLSAFSAVGAVVQAGTAQNAAPEASAEEASLAFTDVPLLETAFVDATPMNRDDTIAVGKLGVDAGDRDKIIELAQEIADGQHGLIDSLLIAHNDKLLFESYYARGRVNLPHFQASTTKAYTSLAVGRAIQMGYLTMADLDKPLISFLENLDPKNFVAGAESITLHNAMTMRSGIRISDEMIEELEKNPDLLKGQKQVQLYLENSEPITAESQSFYYQFIDLQLVMQVLDVVVPGTAKDFIKNELLDKMGIAEYRWRDDISGLPRGYSGSSMTSRNMLKWGFLARNKGQWNGEQLVPEAFVAKSTNSIVRMGDDDIFFTGANVTRPGYGYYWWQADMTVGEKSYFTTSAQGGGGQYIILIEELDLIVVTTAYEREDNTMQMTAERILPAFISESDQ